ncbi:putative disease resistance protein RGA3 [Lolium rigidum]|uniref:putative disease resistance protein RGA3 n=1 Tax=Lolium rigidum TaxID=89674 RepID=UPI001F5CE4DE|nr:putative disease resistance protein RGA3 [Lolium rigidum]
MSHISFESHTVDPYKLETFSDKICWKIMKQKTSFKDRVDKKQLKNIGREIATKCGGVALAAQSLGYTLNGKTSDEWESLCEKYVTQLLGMSFLQYSKTSSTNGQQDKDAFVTMHDLVHDLARAILADQVNVKDKSGGNKCRYALLTDCTKPMQLAVTCPANLRALHFLNCCSLELCDDAFSLPTCLRLRVLDLSKCFIQKLPDSIGQLKQLRFLHAPRIYDKIPNCITELTELNYLSLRGSWSISALPESIGDMRGLMHLDLSGCHGINELPLSFTELKQLVHLDLSNCSMSISEAFGGFTKLQYLNLSCSFYIEAKRIRGLPEVIGKLIKLRYLNLSGCIEIMDPLEGQIIHGLFDSISILSNLEHLVLSGSYVSIPESMGNLRKLHTLDLLDCVNLKKLPGSMVNMVSLKVLIGVSRATLDRSLLSQLNVASLPHFMVHASSDKCSSNIVLLQPTNPNELTIDKLENVKSSVEAQSIKLIDKQNIKELTFQWTSAASRFVDDKEVLEKLVPSSSVQELNIIGYRSVGVPDWLMCISNHLPNLLEIYLRAFPNCNNLPALGQLPKLKLLSLLHMDGLEEWNTAYTSSEGGANEHLFPKLEKLTIKHCAKLRIKPCLPKAMSLCIEDCDVLLSSWRESSSQGGASSSSPVTDITVAESKVPLHQWRLLHRLPALRSLSISHCSDLTASPEIIQCISSLHSLTLNHAELPAWLGELTSLQYLKLSGCGSMTSLPQWLGELTSLKKFLIEYCKGIRCFPDSIQQLDKLECLDIYECPTLEQWCELEENKVKLAHIRKKVFSTCTVKAHELAASGSRVDNKDPLYSAVMNMAGFTEEALLVALSHLLDSQDQGSAYMGMQEEDRVSWLMNFLRKHY